ncbi:MAG: glucosaminidase domain-containing protein [Bacteroidota bacterium]|nr:glucosaminidase domain-containing protein [Bacteroidota bacterium]
MIKNTISFIFLFFSIQMVAQSTQLTRDEYIRKFYKLAISEMQRSGIPASITLAQGCWESGNGNSRLATEANNHFGIKCKSEWRGKKIYHDDDASQECFRKYAHAEASYIDHSNFLMSGSRYSFLFQLDPKDYVEWAHGLKKAGYETYPTYAQRLIKIIEEYKLHVYDEYVDNRQLASLKNETAPVKIQPSTLGKINSRHKIELRNGLRTVVVEEGDNYQSITKDLALKDWELHTYNDIDKDSKVRVNEILYIEAKYKKSNKTHQQHVAEDGDTMHYIAQRYALRMKPLLKRNRMKKGEEPVAGQLVYLRNKKPRKN